jgi:ABC-2 type transport system ATP-binding protein
VSDPAAGQRGDVAISVRGLRKRFGDKVVVHGLDMEVRRGEILGFLGPNGSGKTTAIRMLCGLLTPDGGTGTCLGFDIVREAERIKPFVGYMTQRFSLYDDLSIRENLEFICRMYAIPNRRGVVADCMRRFGLEARSDQSAGTLSGGWKQRLALAACLIHNPAILLLDEPTAGVDPKARRDFWDEIQSLAAGGLSVLVSTHYMDEAERCNRIAYIAYGDLLADDTPENLRRNCGLLVAQAQGGDLLAMVRLIRTDPRVGRAAIIGNTLNVVTRDRNLMDELIQRRGGPDDLVWTPAAPQLEDVFLDLVASRHDDIVGTPQ